MTWMRELRDNFDWPLFATVAVLCIISVVNLYSATHLHPEHADVFVQQIYWLGLGIAAAVLVVVVDYRYIERQGWVIYASSVAVLALLLLLGRHVRGSQRWISVASFSFQPSELAKLALIIALAKYLHHDPKTEGRSLKDLSIPGLILLLPMGLILAQPDLGTALIYAFIFMTIMVLTQLKWRSLFVLLISFVAAAPLTWDCLLKDYQRERLRALLNPEADLLGTGWHTYQSMVAIGSGGLWGKGFQESTQNRYRFLPDQHTDFPFPIWAEEHGFIGALLILALYLFLVLWGLRVASQAKDRFGAVVAVGVSAMIFWHTIVNLGMVCGLLPVVGVTLPFFSYGGSSVLTFMIGIGLLINISMRRFYF